MGKVLPETYPIAPAKHQQYKITPRTESFCYTACMSDVPQISEIEFVKPTSSHRTMVLDYKEEFAKNNEYVSGSADLGSADTFEAWLSNVYDENNLDTISDGRVPATEFLVFRKSDGKLVGMVSIRHKLNAYLEQYGGHIGYSVRKSERRKGYATQMLGLALEYCRSLRISKALVTCDKDNLGSASVIKLNGGRLENEVIDKDGTITQRYRITLS